MKKLKYILLLLSITLTACVSHYENQLEAINTLLDKEQIDSAKNEIQNIRYTELHNESERALFNLIQTRINCNWLLYTYDAADEEDSVDLGGRRNMKNNNEIACLVDTLRLDY